MEYRLHVDSGEPAKKIAVIIPGRNERSALPQYRTIGSYYRQAGITPIFVELNWKTMTANSLTEAAEFIMTDIMRRYPESEMYLFGFSFGAVIAFKMSEMSHFRHLVLVITGVPGRHPVSPVSVEIPDEATHELSYEWISVFSGHEGGDARVSLRRT